ncbi:MAG: hypothetical protein AAF226_02480 [Verrucomicrobiota bacterium]
MKQLLAVLLIAIGFHVEGQESRFKNELVLSATPPVWHIDEKGFFGFQDIDLTMRYWGEIKGENFGFEEWGESKIVKEFRYNIRSLGNTVPLGKHTLGPVELDFAGENYVSNTIQVQVLPPIDSFRGARSHIIPDSCEVGDRVSLVIFQYRKHEKELYDINFRQTGLPFQIYHHGGNSRQLTDSKGDKLWYRMRHYTLVFHTPRSYTISEEHLEKPHKKLTFSETIEVKPKEEKESKE